MTDLNWQCRQIIAILIFGEYCYILSVMPRPGDKGERKKQKVLFCRFEKKLKCGIFINYEKAEYIAVFNG